MLNKEANCFLCGTQAGKQRDINDTDFYFCPNCGEFGITDEASDSITSDKHLYSAILKERALKGLGKIYITDSLVDNIDGIPCMTAESLIGLFPSSIGEILDRSLVNLGNSIKNPSDKLEIDESSRAMLFSRNINDIDYFLQQLFELGYISSFKSSYPSEIALKAKGWEKIEKLKTSLSTRNHAFIAMWFDESTEVIFEKAIKPAVESDKVTTCIRVDKTEHNNKICDQIIAEIRKSRYVIADFTGNRGGVYFEAGFALGLGIPVIWVVQKSHLKNVHFDTRQYNYISYENEVDLLKTLKSRIEATIPNAI